MILEAGRDPVERDPLYNEIHREDSKVLLHRAPIALPMVS
jgi:2-iminoacetate synthase ThiH